MILLKLCLIIKDEIVLVSFRVEFLIRDGCIKLLGFVMREMIKCVKICLVCRI